MDTFCTSSHIIHHLTILSSCLQDQIWAESRRSSVRWAWSLWWLKSAALCPVRRQSLAWLTASWPGWEQGTARWKECPPLCRRCWRRRPFCGKNTHEFVHLKHKRYTNRVSTSVLYLQLGHRELAHHHRRAGQRNIHVRRLRAGLGHQRTHRLQNWLLLPVRHPLPRADGARHTSAHCPQPARHGPYLPKHTHHAVQSQTRLGFCNFYP